MSHQRGNKLSQSTLARTTSECALAIVKKNNTNTPSSSVPSESSPRVYTLKLCLGIKGNSSSLLQWQRLLSVPAAFTIDDLHHGIAEALQDLEDFVNLGELDMGLDTEEEDDIEVDSNASSEGSPREEESKASGSEL